MTFTANTTELLLIGASCRAAAQSARRTLGSAVRIVACDLFGDRDLREACDEVHVIAAEAFPHGFAKERFARPKSANAGQFATWMYCGGIENAPELVAQLSRHRRILGCDDQVLRRTRDPEQVASSLRRAGLPFAPVITATSQNTDSTFDPNLRWLRKPLRSCAGHGIVGQAPPVAEIGGSDGASPSRADDCWKLDLEDSYLQALILGQSQSAAFVANGEACVWLGSAQSYTLGDVSPHHPAADQHPLGYAGSFGPLCVSDSERKQWQRIGNAFVHSFGLRGLFGVDAIRTAAGELIPLEINPRYTASMELLETAHRPSMFALHNQACSGQLPTIVAPQSSPVPPRCKRIVYAREPFEASESTFHSAIDAWLSKSPAACASEAFIADIPNFASPDEVRTFALGEPLFTLLSANHNFENTPVFQI